MYYQRLSYLLNISKVKGASDHWTQATHVIRHIHTCTYVYMLDPCYARAQWSLLRWTRSHLRISLLASSSQSNSCLTPGYSTSFLSLAPSHSNTSRLPWTAQILSSSPCNNNTLTFASSAPTTDGRIAMFWRMPSAIEAGVPLWWMAGSER